MESFIVDPSYVPNKLCISIKSSKEQVSQIAPQYITFNRRIESF